MSRTTCAVPSRRRRKRIRKLAKGFVGDRRNHLRLTSDAVVRAFAFNYLHRKQRKRDYRSLWIQRINTAARLNGLSYSRLIQGLKQAGCELNRKALAELAVTDPAAFAAVSDQAKHALAV